MDEREAATGIATRCKADGELGIGAGDASALTEQRLERIREIANA